MNLQNNMLLTGHEEDTVFIQSTDDDHGKGDPDGCHDTHARQAAYHPSETQLSY